MPSTYWTGTRPKAEGERSASLEDRPAGLEAGGKRPGGLVWREFRVVCFGFSPQRFTLSFKGIDSQLNIKCTFVFGLSR